MTDPASSYEQWHDHFIEISSDWGHIGNVFWINSKTMPHWNPLAYLRITRWGCFIPHMPAPGLMYSGVIPYLANR
jgi:hypothetical protein